MTLALRDNVPHEKSVADVISVVALAASVIVIRLSLLGGGYGESQPIEFAGLRISPSTYLTGLSGPLVFGVGCAFLWLALRSVGFRNAALLVIALSLLPVAIVKSVDSPGELWGISVAFAGLYFLIAKKTLVGGILGGLAISMNILTSLVLLCAIPITRSRFEERERMKLFGSPGIIALSIVIARILVEVILRGTVDLGLKFEPLSVHRLFRIVMVEGYGVLGITAFVVSLGFIVGRWKTARSTEVWWYLVGSGLGCIGVLVFQPNSVPLIVIALYLLMISARILPRTENLCVLLLVAASPFFLMVSQIPLEATLYSNSSTVIEVKHRKLYIDPLQGPVLFERARRAALREARLVESVSGMGAAGVRQPGSASMWLTGYYPVWSIGGTNGGTNNPMYPHEMNWHGLTHIVHFNVGPDSTPPFWHPSSSHTIGTAYADSLEMFYAYGWRFNTSYMMIDSLRKYARANNVKFLLSVGGIWGAQSGAMDYITGDSARTQTFVNAAISFASRNGYEGIEIDWEPPRSEEQMSLLTRIMKRRMTAHLGNNAPLVLAACFECGGVYSPDLQDSVAQYNFMMYDMHQPYNGISGGGPQDPLDVTGFNAPLFPPDKDKYPVLADWEYNYDGTRGGIPDAISPRKFIRMGFPPSKVGMGVPFYGYIYPGKSAPNQQRNGVWAQYLSYIDCLKALGRGGTRNWEEKARVPWIGGTATLDIGWMVKPGQQFYVTYDDTASLREKVLWARHLGLGGVMVYELWAGWLSNEPTAGKDPLLRSVVNAMEERE